MANKIRITLKDGESIEVIYKEVDTSNFSADNVMRINYANIPAEITTFPVLLSKIRILIAEARKEQSMAELNLKIGKSKIRKDYRESENKKKPTIDEVNDHMHCSATYRALNQKFINATFEAEVLDGLYWAMNSKDQKLNIIMKNQDNEADALIEAIEDLEGEEFNGVTIISVKR